MSKSTEHWGELEADLCALAKEVDQMIKNLSKHDGFELEIARLRRAKSLAENGARMVRTVPTEDD